MSLFVFLRKLQIVFYRITSHFLPDLPWYKQISFAWNSDEYLFSTATSILFSLWKKERKVVTTVSDAVPYTIYSELCCGEVKIKVKFVSAAELFSCEY